MSSNRESLSDAFRGKPRKSNSAGIYADLLGPVDRTELEAFSAWHRTLTTTKVVASYRTYLRKAWTSSDVSKLTSNEKSALAKFAEFEELRASLAIRWMAGLLR